MTHSALVCTKKVPIKSDLKRPADLKLDLVILVRREESSVCSLLPRDSSKYVTLWASCHYSVTLRQKK